MVGPRALLVTRALGVHISKKRKQYLGFHMRVPTPGSNRDVSPEERKYGQQKKCVPYLAVRSWERSFEK